MTEYICVCYFRSEGLFFSLHSKQLLSMWSGGWRAMWHGRCHLTPDLFAEMAMPFIQRLLHFWWEWAELWWIGHQWLFILKADWCWIKKQTKAITCVQTQAQTAGLSFGGGNTHGNERFFQLVLFCFTNSLLTEKADLFLTPRKKAAELCGKI